VRTERGVMALEENSRPQNATPRQVSKTIKSGKNHANAFRVSLHIDLHVQSDCARFVRSSDEALLF
jgi:hypothetical protein